MRRTGLTRSLAGKLLFCFGCMLIVLTARADIYKWTDASGKVHFSDKKPEQVSAETVKMARHTRSDAPNETSVMPAVTPEKAASSAPEQTAAEPQTKKKVVMYSASWCGYCKQARLFFNTNAIPFREYDVETSSKGKRDYEKMHGNGVPIILVDKHKMQGFDSAQFLSLYQAE